VNPATPIAALERLLHDRGIETLASLEVFESIESTNDHLMAALPVAAGRAAVCLAMAQSAGRGRRGRTWVSPPGGGIYLSIGWTFDGVPRELASLSLAVGVMIKRALQTLGADRIQLKWPNDLLLDNGKLGGVLIEMRTVPSGAYVVIGIGLNLLVPEETLQRVQSLGGLPPRDLRGSGITTADFMTVSATMIQALCQGLSTFATDGFDAFRDDWLAADCLSGTWVEWVNGEQRCAGIARGIGDDGALLVEHEGRVDRLVAGEVSLRKVA
jgi:BirA family biotin operon repressor/biotin-[acetyl-CoA-carboxylase] ligase